ncbi:hypothetical protein KJ835_02410 [Patescibacteria group bacterium]|nr:hypothetical protein [Patescibacteria group bacterium]
MKSKNLSSPTDRKKRSRKGSEGCGIRMEKGEKVPNLPGDQRLSRYRNMVRRAIIVSGIAVAGVGGSVVSNTCHSDLPSYGEETGLRDYNNKDYVIITRKLFRDTLIRFIEAKEKEGFAVETVMVEDLDNDCNGKSPAEKIKTFIRNRVRESTNFLLVGDTEVREDFRWKANADEDIKFNLEGSQDLGKSWNVPSGYYLLSSSEGDGRTMTISDLYYADLDEWDKDGDGFNDTVPFSEEFDFEAVVGRWPVRTTEDLNKIITKTLNVRPMHEVHFWKSLEFDKEYPENCTKTEMEIRKGALTSPFCAMQIVFAGSDIAMKTHYIEQADVEKGNTAFRKFFVSTDQAVYANFHGSKTSIQGFSVGDVNQFENIIPFYHPESCSMVHYFWGSDDALVEALLKAEKGPAAIVQPPSPSNFYMGISHGKTLGESLYPKGKYTMNRWYSMLLGDPSLKVVE